MGLIVAAVWAALPPISTLSFSARIDQMEAASARAYNGERLNRLVTAVVMDARGIYAADTVEAAKPFGEVCRASLDKIDALLADWRAMVPPERMEAFEAVVSAGGRVPHVPRRDRPAGRDRPGGGQCAGQ